MIATGAFVLAIGLGAVLVTYVPFSPLTAGVITLERETLIRIHRHRHFCWKIAGGAFATALLLGLGLLFGGNAGLLAVTLSLALVLAALFWLSYVPLVMTPPSGAEHLPAVAAARVISDDDIVLGVSVDGEACAYLREQIARPHYFHDRVGGRDLMISFSVLCNSAMVYKPVLNGRHLALRCVTVFNNNIIYFDAASGNYIQQLSGEVIAGPDAGHSLEKFPVLMLPWGEWRAMYPQTRLYDAPAERIRDHIVARVLNATVPPARLERRRRPWHRVPATPATVPAMAVVQGVEMGGDAVAYRPGKKDGTAVINDVVGGVPVAVFFDSARGVSAVFCRELDGQVLEFCLSGEAGSVTDTATGSHWSADGCATGGAMAGRRLQPVAHLNNVFWFSWALFKPTTRVYAAT